MMRGFLQICFLSAAFCLPSFGAVLPELPAAFPATRYEPLIKSLPFALATPVAAAATPGFAANMYVTGLAKIGDQNFVTIAARDNPQTHITLPSEEPNTDGIALVSIEWSDQIAKSKVTVKKGAEFATLEFDQMAAQRPAQITPVPPAMPQAGQPNRPMILPRGQPLPQGVQQIPRTNQPLQPNAPVIVPPNSPGVNPRQRIRLPVINSKPQ